MRKDEVMIDRSKKAEEFIRAWHGAGFRLIALHKGSKIPVDDDWAANVKTPKEIARWLARGGNYGFIVPPEFLICDADSRSGGREGLAQFKYDSELDLDWDRVPMVRTGGYHAPTKKFGRHAVFRKPPNINVVGRDKATGLEWRSSRVGTSGKYIVGGYSRHPDSGALYVPLNSIPPAEAPMLPRYWLDKIAKQPKATGDDPAAGQVTPERLAEILAFLDPHDYASNAEWEPLMMACHAATNGEGQDAFIAWSMGDPGYMGHDEIIATRWDSCDANEPGGITARTLFRAAIDAGCPFNLLPGHVAPEDCFDDVEIIGDVADDDEL